jgi:hypothetical protein
LAKVDEICEAVSQIEQTVMLLDDYTMRCAASLCYLRSLLTRALQIRGQVCLCRKQQYSGQISRQINTYALLT